MTHLEIHVPDVMSVNVNMISLDVHVSSGMSVCWCDTPWCSCVFWHVCQCWCDTPWCPCVFWHVCQCWCDTPWCSCVFRCLSMLIYHLLKSCVSVVCCKSYLLIWHTLKFMYLQPCLSVNMISIDVHVSSGMSISADISPLDIRVSVVKTNCWWSNLKSMCHVGQSWYDTPWGPCVF